MKIHSLESKEYRKKKIANRIGFAIGSILILNILFNLNITWRGKDKENKNIDIIDITLSNDFDKSFINIHLEK